MAIEQVRSLVADRHRYESWLEALDARRNETPERVYARVHDDYSARRADVLAQLEALLPDMTALREAREQHLHDLEGQLSSLEDERAEAMLRTAVGEFDAERWDAVRVEVEGKLVAIGEERDALLIEVDEIRTLIDQSRDDAVTASVLLDEVPIDEMPVDEMPVDEMPVDEMPVDEMPVDEVTVEAVAMVEPVEIETEAIEGPMILDNVEELEETDARLAAEMAPAAVVEAMPVAHEVDEAIGGIPRDAWLDATADISDEVGTPVAPPAAADTVNMASAIESVLLDPEAPLLPPVTSAPAEPDEWDEALGVFDGKPAVGGPPVTPVAPAAASAPSADPFDDLAFLRSIMDPAETPASPMKTPKAGAAAVPEPAAGAEDSQKSLRCAECGTMNAPTEWYCERCGGELITI